MKELKMKRLTTTVLVLVLTAFRAAAQDVAYTILSEADTVIKTRVAGITLDSRAVRRYVYEYASKDADGHPATVSGVVMIPQNVLEGTSCDGIMLFNHATLSSPEDAPSQGNAELVNGLIANPLRPNYILVMSDYIGYGSSASHPLFYHSGDVNARNILDGLLAARQLLNDRNIPQGKYLFNLGFSQGGSESLYVAKLRDMEYKDKGITFSKTFAGGGPTDYVKAYQEFVKADTCQDVKDVVMMMVSAVENLHLGIQYTDLFQEPLASIIPDLIKEKDKGVFSRVGIGMEGRLSKLIQPAYMNLESAQAKAFMAALEKINLMNGWKIDPTQRYFIAHSRHDNYVPIQSVRAIIPWMMEQGFTPSVIPGKTNLQTNTLIIKANHTVAAIVWLVQTIAAIQFWPVAYYEGDLNRYYDGVVKDLDIMKIITILKGWGLDVRKLVNISQAPQHRASALGTLLSLFPGVVNTLAKVDLTTEDLSEMLHDAGITDEDLIRVAAYLLGLTDAAPSADTPASAPSLDALWQRTEAPVFLLQHYERTLADWFKQAGYDVEYQKWGWGNMEDETAN